MWCTRTVLEQQKRGYSNWSEDLNGDLVHVFFSKFLWQQCMVSHICCLGHAQTVCFFFFDSSSRCMSVWSLGMHCMFTKRKKVQFGYISVVWLETLAPWKSDYHIAFRSYSDWISAYRNMQSTLTHSASTQWNEADNKKQFISNKCIICPWQYTYFPHAEENQHKVHLNKGLLVLRQA